MVTAKIKKPTSKNKNYKNLRQGQNKTKLAKKWGYKNYINYTAVSLGSRLPRSFEKRGFSGSRLFTISIIF
jgi:hypothetical protein